LHEFFAKICVAKPILNQAEGISPARFFAFFQTPAIQNQRSGEKKGRTMNPLIQLKTTSPLLITLALLCFELVPRVQALLRHRMAATPGAIRQKGRALFLLSPLADSIRRSATFR
jgi:hypothetical protein